MAENNTASETTTVIAVADVRVAGATATAPLELLLGASAPASVAVTVENAGPSSPVDTVVTTRVTADPGVVEPGGVDVGPAGAGRRRPGRSYTFFGGDSVRVVPAR